MGGRVRITVTGAAPISPSVLTFLRAALGCQVSWGFFLKVRPVWLCPNKWPMIQLWSSPACSWGDCCQSSVFTGCLIWLNCNRNKILQGWLQNTLPKNYPVGSRKRNRAAEIGTCSTQSEAAASELCGLSWQLMSSQCSTFENRVQRMRWPKQGLDRWTWRTSHYINKTKKS